jgi:beta-lactamase regulating signal transducer with metallopeptidase domain
MLLEITVTICAFVLIYSFVFLLSGRYRRSRLVHDMFPHAVNESVLDKTELKQINKRHREIQSKSLGSFFGYVYLIINIPGAAFCNTMYRMDKAGISGYIVASASAFAYAVIIPLIYFLAQARVPH